MSMVAYFQDMLTEGEVPKDPFEAATKRVSGLTEEQKEAYRLFWNNRIANHYGENSLRRSRNRRKAYRLMRRS